MLPQPLDQMLACASVREDLASLLLYDAAPPLLEQVARAWQGKLAAVHGQPVPLVRLNPWTNDDDLWGLGDELPEIWRHPGLLATEEPRLVLIQDLPRLTLAALRACVSLMGSEVAAIERAGQSLRFRPRFWWLAGCSLADVGQLSPHLLDRFAMRIRAPAATVDREQLLLEALEEEPLQAGTPEAAAGAQLAAAAHVPLELTAEAREEAISQLPAHLEKGHRGLLSLVRVACALAQLEQAKRGEGRERRQCLREHVQQASRLLELRQPRAIEEPRPPDPKIPAPQDTSRPALDSPMPPQPQPTAPGPSVAEKPPGTPATSRSAESAALGSEQAQGAAELTPLEAERKAPVQREPTPLRLPFVPGQVSAKGRGSVVGVQPASDLQDLSILGTLLAAAPYQRHRRKRSRTKRTALRLLRSDLRSYRRAPTRQHLLVVVLDFTSLDRSDWHKALLPYMAQAYVDRAQIGIISVGAHGAEHELRAQRVLARNLLVPTVAEALEAAPGRATPLADGLDLALSTLRRALTVGRGAVRDARLVVLTDGRGNIPLEASQRGALATPVGTRGVEDALRLAAQLRAVRQLTSVVLSPQVSALRELPQRLADALGAKWAELPPQAQPEKGASV